MKLFKQLAVACGILTALVSGLALYGWLTGLTVLASIHIKYIPMAPSTAILFFVLGLNVILIALWPNSRWVRWLTALIILLSLAVMGTALYSFITGINLSLDKLIVGEPKLFNHTVSGRMSPLSAGNFLLLCLALTFFLFNKKAWTAWLATIALLFGWIILIGYLFNAPLFYGGPIIPVALLTAWAFMVIGVGLLAAQGQDTWLYKITFDRSTKYLLLRFLLPAGLLFLFINEFNHYVLFRETSQRGALVFALEVIFSLSCLALLISWLAAYLGDRLGVLETELEKNKNKFQTFFELTSDLVVIADIDGYFREINPAWVKTLGYSRKELLGKPYMEFIHPDDKEKTRRVIAEKLKRGETVLSFENRYLRRDGGVVWLEWTSQPQLEIGLTFAIARDITRRKQIEEAMTAQDAQFKKLSSSVPGMIYQFLRRPDGTYCVPFTNEAIKDIFGCSPEAVRQDFSPIAKVILAEDLPQVIASIERSAKELTVWQFDYRVQLPGQPVKWLQGLSTPEKLADGSILWSGFNTDITERKQAEAKIKHLNSLLHGTSKINQLLLQEKDRKSLFEQACKILLEVMDCSFVWIGTIKAGNYQVVPEAQAGREEGYLSSIQVTWDDTPTGRGPTGMAIKTHKPVITCNMKTDPLFFPWREEALKRGYASSIAVPIIYQNHVYGTFNKYSERIDAFGEEEISILTELGEDLGFALHNIGLNEERKQNLAALKANEAALNEAQRLANIGSWSWEVATDRVEWSAQLYQINGHDPKLPPPGFAKLEPHYTPAGWKLLNAAVAKALSTGEPYELELELLRQDGKIITTLARGAVDRDAKGKIIGLHGTVQDLTTRKQMEEALKLSEQRFRDLFNGATEGLTLMTMEGKFAEVNRTFAEMHGYTLEEMKALDMMKLDVMKEKTFAARADIIAQQQAGKTIRFEVEHYHKDGHIFPLSVTSTVVTIGDKPYYLAFHQDITERKQTENTLKRKLEELEIFYQAAMDREDKILELKNKLEERGLS